MRRLIGLVLLCLVASAAAVRASGEGAATFYNQGNAAFLAGQFDEAVALYEKARGQGSDDARLFYNMGCAHLRAGRLGQAIRFFEMARVRAPRDADIRFNLDYAISRRADALPETDRSLVIRLARLPLERMTGSELAATGAALFVAGFFVMGAGWPRRREKRGRAVIAVSLVFVALAIVAGGYAFAHHREFHSPRVVVGADQLDVKSGPGLDNPTLFTVHAGMEARVRETRGTWTLVEIPTGFSGWAPNEALLPVG